MNAQTQYNLETKPSCVLAGGPYETDGDGGYEYCVCFGDEDGEEIMENKKCVWYLFDYEEVCSFVRQLCDQFNLEDVNEASPP